MLDRVPLYPGRVKLMPVSGQANTYDMVRADEPTQEGTALNKANLLADTTAEMFGFDEKSAPNDILSWLGKYNLYWWKHRTSKKTYTENIGQETNLTLSGTSSGIPGFFMSDTITISDSGVVSLADPQSGVASNIPGKYFSATELSGAIFYAPQTSNVVTTPVPPNVNVSINPCYLVTAREEVFNTEWVYEQSLTKEDCPETGFVGETEYVYLGIPFNNAVEAENHAKIEMVSYIGTGAYGSESPCSLTFSFAPKLVIIQNDGAGNSGKFMILVNPSTRGGSQETNALYTYSEWDGNTVYWYNTKSESDQFNIRAYPYHAVSIGMKE